ncbi:uncharacterized protein LOC135217724 [Macrobrachium nipponense]|uniref:uncharacterized protein LOC135217724 n=1 Tax=Macrobrachium nipponense TaxID=159736 RepID=UPI0030C7E97F
MHPIIEPCFCPKSNTTLSGELLDAAIHGRYDQIHSYLETGADINAKDDLYGWTLLSAACSKGHRLIVGKLLKHPDLHLNIPAMGSSALTCALDGKHTDCVKLLLQSSLKCTLNLDLCWGKLVSFISSEPKLWFDLITKTASYYDMEKLAEVICMKSRLFVPDVRLAMAAVEGSIDTVTEILATKEGIEKFLDGTLIAVSSFDITERVAEILIGYSYEYKLESIEISMILSSMNNHLGILPVLLKKFLQRISYAALSTAHEATIKAGHRNAMRLLEKALVFKCEMFIAIPK